MKPQPPYDHSGDIFRINTSLCWALFCVCTAYWVWPSDPRWYAWYGFSVILCLAALALVSSTVPTMRKIKRDRDAWKRILQLGNAPQNAKLMTKRDLQDAGMN